ncbi:hypothetical protein [Embleya sp. NPDC059237]|uniref:hypothetical protein n=1 Tax=Embleya sp. NPDC059237 TaxID=3346784 RepID=UPI0036C8B62B
MTAKSWAWVGGMVAGAALVGLAVYLAVVGLDEADKWASVLGLFVALAGLVVSMAGVRRERSSPGGQSVEGSVTSAGIAQVSDTGGSVRITRRGPGVAGPPPGAPGVPPVGGTPPAGDGQRVRDSAVGGPVDQVRNTGGDVEIDEGP